MADNKDGREKQAANAEQRQRTREIEAELERSDDPEPPVDTSVLAYFETELDALAFPASGTDIIDAIGDREIEAGGRAYEVQSLLADTDAEHFETPQTVRVRVQRPTVAEAMKRVVEAAATAPNVEFGNSQWDAYERTFLALRSIDADDDDEGVEVLREWIVERIREDERLPGSRDVRRRAAEFCRSNGYEVRNDEWIGV